MRKILLVLLGIIIVGSGALIAKKFADSKRIPVPRERKVVTSVFTQTVSNTSSPITITTNGLLTAKYRMELYSEVQGIFESSSRDFKPGAYYPKNEILLSINSDEHHASLRAQKSNLFNQIVLLLPDLRLDYPDAFEDWDSYVKNFDLEGPLMPLPKPKTDREKLFVTGRNIYSPYYAVKNLEERMDKYTIRAPYGGVLTESLVDKGTLIRAGQKIGTFINPTIYELAVPINSQYGDYVQVGQKVKLHDIEKTKSWEGKVIRLNSIVDPNTQSVQAFIQVRGKNLREGMYLEASLDAREEKNTFEIDRKLLNNNLVFYVRDSLLLSTEVEPVFYKEQSVIVRGLEDGMQILSKPLPGAHEGMPIQVLQNVAETN